MLSMMTRLIRKLRKKELRDIYVESAISDVISTQIFNLRKSRKRNWSQRDLAKKVKMAQPRIAVLEGADYENYTISTLKRLASAFDVALIVKFAPFSELIKFKENFSSHDLQISSFDEEFDLLADELVAHELTMQWQGADELTAAEHQEEKVAVRGVFSKMKDQFQIDIERITDNQKPSDPRQIEGIEPSGLFSCKAPTQGNMGQATT